MTEQTRFSVPAVTMTQSVFYCAAAGVSDPIHFDRVAAAAAGFDDAVVNGSLRAAVMTEALASVTGGRLVRSFESRHRNLLLLGQPFEIVVEPTSDGYQIANVVGSRVVDTGFATLDPS